MAALFACTKCHSRFPFEDLSHGDQLCKACRSNFPVVKCTYCRAEFQLSGKGSTSTVCDKCSQNVRVYGKPKACEYCSVLAAFIGKRCQRCVNSEKKWGPPITCEQCKLKCAYDRRDGSKKKVDGKRLCWLCTQAYKRVLAKTRNVQDLSALAVKKSSSSSQHDPHSLDSRILRLTAADVNADDKSALPAAILRMASSNTKPSTPTPVVMATSATNVTQSSSENKMAGPNGHHQHRRSHSRSRTEKTASTMDRAGSVTEKGGAAVAEVRSAAEREEKEGKHQRSRSHHRHHHHHHHHHSKHRHSKRAEQQSNSQNKEDTEESSPSKKPKLDKVLTNGVSTPKSTGSNVSDSGAVDRSSSENVIMITQLREQIESLKKQLAAKDAQLLEKDRRINELKAENYEADKEARLKVQTVQKQHEEALSNLQAKNRELQRQVTKLSKGVKKSVLDAITSSG